MTSMTTRGARPHRPRVRHSTRYSVSIDDYQADFASIWHRDLSERSAFDQWLHVIDHASRVGRAIRIDNVAGVIDDLADTAAWLMSFIEQCRSSQNPLDVHFRFTSLTSDLIWNKFPGQCASCFDDDLLRYTNNDTVELDRGEPENSWEDHTGVEDWLVRRAEAFERPLPCSCLARAATARARRDFPPRLRVQLDNVRVRYADSLRAAGKKPATMLELEALFETVFRNQQRVLPLQTIAFHLLEEVGDATQALKDCYTFDAHREKYSEEQLAYRKRRLQEEVADVFSWMFAMELKVRSLYHDNAIEYAQTLLPRGQRGKEKAPLRFSDVIWSKYGTTRDGGLWESLKCTGCESAPCACPRELRIVWGVPVADETELVAASPSFVDDRALPGGPTAQISAVAPVVIVSPKFVLSADMAASATAEAAITTAGPLVELYGLAADDSREAPEASALVSQLASEVNSLTPRVEQLTGLVAELLRRVPEHREPEYRRKLQRVISALLLNAAGNAVVAPFAPQLQELIQELGRGLS